MHTKGNRPRRSIKHRIAVCLALVCLLVLLVNVYHNYDVLHAHNVIFAPGQFSLSVLPLVLSYLFIPSMWRRILASVGVALPYRKAFCIQYLAHFGRYIPGKIWAYVAQAYLASQEHVAVAETLWSNVVLMGLMNLSGLLVFALSFVVWDVWTLELRCGLVCSLVVLLSWLCRGHILERGVNAIIARCAVLDTGLRCSALPYTPLLVETALSWLVFAVGMHCMLTSFYPVEMRHSIMVIGIFAIAWLAGYYAFIAPGGLGVQEGIQVYLLTFFFPLPIAIVMALASRLWMLLGDTIVFLLAVVLTIYDHRLQRSPHGSHL